MNLLKPSRMPDLSTVSRTLRLMQWEGNTRLMYLVIECTLTAELLEESLAQARAWFLASGRSPRVILKDAGSVKTLMYTCTARDQSKGVVTIHCAPPEFEAIKLWLAELDLDLKYTGSGHPAARGTGGPAPGPPPRRGRALALDQTGWSPGLGSDSASGAERVVRQ